MPSVWSNGPNFSADACPVDCVAVENAATAQQDVTAETVYLGAPVFDASVPSESYIREGYSGVGVDDDRTVKLNLGPQQLDGEMFDTITTTFGLRIHGEYLPLVADVEGDGL